MHSKIWARKQQNQLAYWAKRIVRSSSHFYRQLYTEGGLMKQLSAHQASRGVFYFAFCLLISFSGQDTKCVTLVARHTSQERRIRCNMLAPFFIFFFLLLLTLMAQGDEPCCFTGATKGRLRVQEPIYIFCFLHPPLCVTESHCPLLAAHSNENATILNSPHAMPFRSCQCSRSPDM